MGQELDHVLRTKRIQLGTRYFWVIVGLSVLVFAAWIAYGLYYNAHHDTKSAPLRVVIWFLFGFATDVIIWAVALISALSFAALRRQRPRARV
jgi:hypothetical protein